MLHIYDKDGQEVDADDFNNSRVKILISQAEIEKLKNNIGKKLECFQYPDFGTPRTNPESIMLSFEIK